MLPLAAMLVAAAPPAQPTLPVYLGLGGAPPALHQRVEERLTAILVDRGVPLVRPPADAASTVEARVAEAKRELERGVAAYRKLDLDIAIAALGAAEEKATASPAAIEAAGIVAEARVHLGLIALATGKAAEADTLFRRVAALDPERRIDGRLHPPEVVAAYEKARRAVASGPQCDLTLSAKPASATITVDGRPASGTVRLPYGEHFVQASTDLGSAGERVELAQPRSLAELSVRSKPGTLVEGLRAAARRGDDAAAGAAADALAAATGARRVVIWDLRQQGGRVEAPMRLRSVDARAFTWGVVADLGTAAAPDVPLRKAVAELLDESRATASGEPGRPPPGGATPRSRGMPAWVWWAAGGAALAAAGGAALLAFPPNGSKQPGDDVVIVVEK